MHRELSGRSHGAADRTDRPYQDRQHQDRPHADRPRPTSDDRCGPRTDRGPANDDRPARTWSDRPRRDDVGHDRQRGADRDAGRADHRGHDRAAGPRKDTGLGANLSAGFQQTPGAPPEPAREDRAWGSAPRRPRSDGDRGGRSSTGPRSAERRPDRRSTDASDGAPRGPERGSRRREEDIGESWPDLPEWATPDELETDVLRDLRGLSKDGAEFVAGHLVAAGALADEEPELAWLHARAARARGGRIAVVRETVGLVAYRAGEWAEAIGELRAARRMGGGPGHLAVMADSERALGHPERAIELSRSAEADDLDEDAAIELAIVVAGARADLGQIDAALAHLERIGWREDAPNARIAYAYADLLLQAGRKQEALTWFVRSADADADEETDAGERLAQLSASLDEAGSEAAVTGSSTPEAQPLVDGVPEAGTRAGTDAQPDSAASEGVDDGRLAVGDGSETNNAVGDGSETTDAVGDDSDHRRRWRRRVRGQRRRHHRGR